MTLMQRTIEDSVTTLRGLTVLEEPLNRAAKMVLRCLTSGHKLLVCGNEFMTAVCNDYSADEIFARQVWGLGEKGDVLIAFTTSGKSRNILRALEEAKRKGVESICFLGRDGGFTKGVATLDLIAPGSSTALDRDQSH